jgi:hypothetical protein
LLKRGYTIDSWDFQPDDQYLVHFPMGSEQQIDPTRTQFVIFFGDNTAYAHACDQLAEMLGHAGRTSEAETYRMRAHDIRERIDKLAWNGRFYTHHVEEDSSVHHDLGGVPEREQFAMSNAYSLNRGVTQAQAKAIIESYEKLRANLPPGSPGEWYSVFPPYERGFGGSGGKWQYMNAGVHVHAAGELARGAFTHGFEEYGADILTRLEDLGHKHGDKLFFAYTGAFPPSPPAPHYTPVDLSSESNMSLSGHPARAGELPWMAHADENDMRNLPTGKQLFGGIPFLVSPIFATPETSIPVHAQANALYLLHAAEKVTQSKVAAVVRFHYSDGSSWAQYLLQGRDVGGTWFPNLNTATSGVAWRGANGVCGDVGVYWAAIPNPDPGKTIEHLTFSPSEDGSRYALLGVTLADRMPWHPADPVSFGGPDNWSAALVTAAIFQGIAGVEDKGTAYSTVELSPRWTATGLKSASVTARYAASEGYVSYRWQLDQARREITLDATGNAGRAHLRLLLPSGATSASVPIERVEQSVYALVDVPLRTPVHLVVSYK